MNLVVIGLQIYMLNYQVLNLVWFLIEERMDMLLLFGSEAGVGSLINTKRVITEALGYCNNIYVCSGNSVIVKIHTAKK